MSIDLLNLPESRDSLKEIIFSFADKHRNHELEINLLREQIRALQARLYARKTEKFSHVTEAEQPSLFDEAEQNVFESDEEVTEEIEVAGHTRKIRGRKPLPADLPRIEVVHDVSEEEKLCGCGSEKSCIGKEVSEQLDIIPAKIQVLRHVRLKYACRNCEGVEDDGGAVCIAPVPPQMIPKSMASPGLLAHVLTAKLVDAVPFYRQEKQLARLGVDLPRATMCGWAMKAAERCQPLLDLLCGEIRSGPLIHIDETTVQVLEEPGRPATTKSYMWLFRGGPEGRPSLIYQYHPTRAGDVAAAFLRGFTGYVQTDGYAGYDFLDDDPDFIHLGCWAHVRRKFVDVIKAAPKPDNGNPEPGSADVALHYIRKLYAIEKRAQVEDLSSEELFRERQQKAKPVLDEIKEWLDAKSDKTPPRGLLGRAVCYALKQWPRLIRYIEDGRLRPDNNLAENAIRPFVVGRKNWLFSGHPLGAKASAALYSLIETAKANGLEPYSYLRFLFEKLPRASTPAEFKALLPQYVDRSQLLR